MNLLSELLIGLISGYLIGSVPVGPMLVSQLFNKDILEFGSKSAGATNVARLLGIPYFFLVLFLDALKSFCLLYCLSLIFPQMILYTAACGLILGNRYSIFLNARGGKGVATCLGIILFLFPYSTLIVITLTWCLALIVTKKVGLASISAALICLVTSILYLLVQGISYQWSLGILLSAHVLYTHTSHIMNFLYSD